VSAGITTSGLQIAQEHLHPAKFIRVFPYMPCHCDASWALSLWEPVLSMNWWWDNHFVDCVGLSSHFEAGNHSEKFLSVFDTHLLYPSNECGLCHWFKCEHDCVTGLKCEYGPNDKTQFWKYILKKFNLFTGTKISQNSISSPTLALKIIKSSLINLTHQGLSSNTKNLPPISFKILFLILLIFLWQSSTTVAP
jgi:hypothetical protein